MAVSHKEKEPRPMIFDAGFFYALIFLKICRIFHMLLKSNLVMHPRH